MATIDLGTLTFLTLRAEMGVTPGSYEQYNGLSLTIPGNVTLPPLGEQSILTASGVTVYGYTRTSPGGGLEWLMTAPVDPAIALTDAIPGPDGWDDEPARVGYYQQAKYLLGVGVSGATLWPGLKNFYDWAKADLVAKGWTPGP